MTKPKPLTVGMIEILDAIGSSPDNWARHSGRGGSNYSEHDGFVCEARVGGMSIKSLEGRGLIEFSFKPDSTKRYIDGGFRLTPAGRDALDKIKAERAERNRKWRESHAAH